jgi:hypothetical protein
MISKLIGIALVLLALYCLISAFSYGLHPEKYEDNDERTEN